MSYQETFKKLEQNPQAIYNEAVRVLCKIADNILKSPKELKIRTLQKNNTTIANKILSVNGGKECLTLMGFDETKTAYIMPRNVSLEVVQEFKKNLLTWAKLMEEKTGRDESKSNFSSSTSSVQDKRGAGGSKDGKPTHGGESKNEKLLKPTHGGESRNEKLVNSQIIRKTALPPLEFVSEKYKVYSNPFLRTIETYCHNALQYEDTSLQGRLRSLIPITTLEENSLKSLRKIQQHIKKNKMQDNEMSVQDMLILELLRWFKEDFFEWVNSPECHNCGSETTFSHMSTDSELLRYTNKVELHKCNSCQRFTPFPRYNDLNILLETRKGRCGEWAHTFTLCCRSMGWDSRFVVDEGDHVWTEVYSVTQKRWLHCDPCENLCDSPLVYECGWRKQISYVMAYSAEEVQDVTWRYSSDHKEVLKRRRSCSESELLDALLRIRTKQQKDLSQSRKNYLSRSTLMELVEFLTEKKPDDADKKGRSSGSAVWRLARGEIEEPSEETLHIWKINKDDIVDNTVIIRYSSTLDKYEYVSGGKVLKSITGWYKGAFEHSSVFRKEEKDWKMVYLARKEGEDKGTVSWKFDLSNSSRTLDTACLKFDYYTIGSGEVEVRICSETTSLLVSQGVKMSIFQEFTGSKELSVNVSLSGGEGDVSWQQAQLFRQSMENEEFEFSLTLTFKS